MIEIEKPKLECVESSSNYGKFVIEPLERGFGTTEPDAHASLQGISELKERKV